MTNVSRRTVTKGIVWSAPAISAVAVAPAFAASPPACDDSMPTTRTMTTPSTRVPVASSEQNANPDGPASWAFDNNTGSYWHSRYSPTAGPTPHWIGYTTGTALFNLNQVTYLPRQPSGSSATANGTATQFHIDVTRDNGATWTTVGGPYTVTDSPLAKTVDFPRQTCVNGMRLVMDASAGGFGTAAEITVYDGPLDRTMASGWSLYNPGPWTPQYPATDTVRMYASTNQWFGAPEPKDVLAYDIPGDFAVGDEISVKVTGQPALDSLAGLSLFTDGANFVTAALQNRSSAPTGQRIQSQSQSSSTAFAAEFQTANPGSPVWLKLTRTAADTVDVSYSTNGTTWTVTKTWTGLTLPWSDVKAGLFASNTNATAYPALTFTEFRLNGTLVPTTNY